jgi:hypothetical protein
MAASGASFDYTTDVQRLMDDLKDWLKDVDQTVTPTPSVVSMVEAYGTLCRELNDRLRRCQEFLRLNLWSAAIQLSEIEPNLPDRFSHLSFEDLRPELMDRCSRYEILLETPPTLLEDIYGELNDGYEHHLPLERLFAKNRLLALRRVPLKDRLKAARTLLSRDGRATFWEDDVIGFERARIDEIKEEASRANAEGDKGILEDLLEELRSPNWIEVPKNSLIDGMKTAISRTDHMESRERLPELTESLRAQWEYWGRSFQESNPLELSRNSNWLTVVKMLNEWFDTAETVGVLTTDPLYRQVVPIDEAVRPLEKAAQQAIQQADAIQRLRAALRDPSAKRSRLESLYAEASRWTLVPIDLKEAYDRRMKSLWWRGNWERVLGVGLILVMVLAGIAFAVFTNS